MLQSRIQKQIPERLSHYTTLEALKSILSDEEGKGICLWAFSNKHKNDDQEIKMGEYMLKRVRKALSTKSSLLHQLSGYENTASVSFMEGDVNQHMLDVYGRYRLEFDLRKVGIGILSEGLVDCEYAVAHLIAKMSNKKGRTYSYKEFKNTVDKDVAATGLEKDTRDIVRNYKG